MIRGPAAPVYDARLLRAPETGMRHHFLIAALLVATAGTAEAQVMNVRTGGWDVSMKDNSGAEIKSKMCLKKEDLDAGEVFRRHEDAENCKTTRGVRTTTRLTYTIVCTGADASRSEIEVVASSREVMTMKVRTEGADAGTMNVTARFASASCKGFED